MKKIYIFIISVFIIFILYSCGEINTPTGLGELPTPPRGSISGKIYISKSGRVLNISTSGTAPKKSISKKNGTDFVPGEIIIKFRSGIDPETELNNIISSFSNYSIELKRRISAKGPFLLVSNTIINSTDDKKSYLTEQFASQLNEIKTVKYTALNNIVKTKSFEPTDPGYKYQKWNYNMINCPGAWDITTGKESITVAVIDDGVWHSHPDLQNNICTGGYDFVSDTDNAGDGDGWDIYPLPYFKDNIIGNHGTRVAGIIAGLMNNSIGGTGIAPKVKILPVRVLGKNGGTTIDICAGIRYAAGIKIDNVPLNPNPAKILNLSFGNYNFNPAEQDAVSDAAEAGVIMIAAAGNEKTSSPLYPASYNNVISVAAVSSTSEVTSYSNYGSFIDLCAPGGDVLLGTDAMIYCPVRNANGYTYSYGQGTSLAAPHVSGAAALILSVNPDLTPQEVETILKNTAIDKGDEGWDIYYGDGIVNAYSAAAYSADIHPETVPLIHITPSIAKIPSSIDTLTVNISKTGSANADLINYDIQYVNGTDWLTVSGIPSTVPADITLTVDRSNLSYAYYSAIVKITTKTDTLTYTHYLPVEMIYSGESAISDTMIVSLIDISDNSILESTIIDKSSGYTYEFSNVPDGSYMVTALIDRNNDSSFNRVDEWYGLYEKVDVDTGLPYTGNNFTIFRYDEIYSRQGSGEGSINGAIAIYAYDDFTGLPVQNASVYLDSDSKGVTDIDGRLIITGSYTDSQVITVAADDYQLMTYYYVNSQFLAFPLSKKVYDSVTITVTPSSQDVKTFLFASGSISNKVKLFTDPETSVVINVFKNEKIYISGLSYNANDSLTRYAFNGPYYFNTDTEVILSFSNVNRTSGFLANFDYDSIVNFNKTDDVMYTVLAYSFTDDNIKIPLGINTALNDTSINFEILNISSRYDTRIAFFATDKDSQEIMKIYPDDTPVVPPDTIYNISLEDIANLGYPDNVYINSSKEFAFTGPDTCNFIELEIYDENNMKLWSVIASGDKNIIALPSPGPYDIESGKNYYWQVIHLQYDNFNINDFYFKDIEKKNSARYTTYKKTFKF